MLFQPKCANYRYIRMNYRISKTSDITVRQSSFSALPHGYSLPAFSPLIKMEILDYAFSYFLSPVLDSYWHSNTCTDVRRYHRHRYPPREDRRIHRSSDCSFSSEHPDCYATPSQMYEPSYTRNNPLHILQVHFLPHRV